MWKHTYNLGMFFCGFGRRKCASVGFKIKQEIFREFGHDVPVVAIGKEDLELCFKNNPYLKEKDCDTKKLYVAFISKVSPLALNDLKISNFKPDEATIDSSRIYIKYAVGAGKTKLDQKYIEKKLNVMLATVRNWNTVTTLLNMYDKEYVDTF